jgi:predicted Zn-dependent protease
MVRNFEAGHPLMRDAMVSSYVEKLARKFEPLISAHVIDSAEEWGAAFAPGYIGVTAGLMLRAQNEAELAGVLAHLIAHAEIGANGSRIIIAGLDSGLCLRFATAAPGADSLRERERIADQAALGLLERAGYDRASLFEFFSKLRYEKPGLWRGFSLDDLVADRSQMEFAGIPGGDRVLDTSEFQMIRKRLRPFSTRARQLNR